MLERGLLSRILFPAPVPSYSAESYPEELIWVPKAENDAVPCLLLTYPSARFLVIFFHSNAEDLGRCRGFCCYLREQFQVHVLAVEYPGYGACPGVPTGESVMENAFAALRFAREELRWPLDSIKIFGRSIGTGPAVGLASSFLGFAGVILVTPFLSVQELFRDRVGLFAGLVEEWFCNQGGAPKISCPTMIIHGQRDELISFRHSEALFKLLTCRKLLVSPPDMEHNTNLLTNLQIFVLPMFQFFALPDYVFQNMKVPAWAYCKPRRPSLHSGDFEVIAEEAMQLRPQRMDSRPRAATAPRRPSSEFASPAAKPKARARSASSPRSSPWKFTPPTCNPRLTTPPRDQQQQQPEAGVHPGPRPLLVPLLGISASGGTEKIEPDTLEEDTMPEETHHVPVKATCTRNLAMSLLPEDPGELLGPSLTARLGSKPSELLSQVSLPRESGEDAHELPVPAPFARLPGASGEPQDPGADTSQGQRVASAADGRGGADGGVPAEGGADVAGGAGGLAEAVQRPSSEVEKEEAIRRLAEFAGAMCAAEICSDQLVGEPGLQGKNRRELTSHERALEKLAERVRKEKEAPLGSRGRNQGLPGCLPAAPRWCSADERPVELRGALHGEALVAAKHSFKGTRCGAEDSVWGHCCGRSSPSELYEARDAPQAQLQARPAATAPRQSPPVLDVSSQLGLCRRGAQSALMASCCRGLPPEVASDLLSPKPASSMTLPQDEELLEHLRPAAFLLPRRKRLSI
uniref:Serine aminopeptidase S33 domain-containing protein n=1 Tax=Alexandrium monilatum TaxID=311494 RepID=A0A7S4V3U6_9DINO